MDELFNVFDSDWEECSDSAYLDTNQEKLLSKRIEALVWRLIGSDQCHFEIVQCKSGGKLHVSGTGRSLMVLVDRVKDVVRSHKYTDKYNVDPIQSVFLSSARAYHSAYNELLLSGSPSLESQVMLGVAVVEDIRFTCRQLGLEQLKRKMDKGVAQRKASVLAYIDSLFNYRARLLVVRLDLHYRKGRFLERETFFEEDLARVKHDWDALYHDIKNGLVSDLVGFVVKIEYGILTGFHMHTLLMFDGSKRRGDVVIAEIIGRHWVSKVTNGLGRYYSCNRNAQLYRSRGIGMIHRSDDLRNNLNDVVAQYLVKADTVLSWMCPRKRTFFRGWTVSSIE